MLNLIKLTNYTGNFMPDLIQGFTGELPPGYKGAASLVYPGKVLLHVVRPGYPDSTATASPFCKKSFSRVKPGTTRVFYIVEIVTIALSEKRKMAEGLESSAKNITILLISLYG